MAGNGGLQMAELYDGVHDGTPYIAAHRIGVLDINKRQLIAQGLQQGTVVMQLLTPAPDVLTADNEAAVEVGYATDGTFVWSLATAHYVLQHGVALDSAFHAHLQLHNYQLDTPPLTEELEQAVNALLDEQA